MAQYNLPTFTWSTFAFSLVYRAKQIKMFQKKYAWGWENKFVKEVETSNMEISFSWTGEEGEKSPQFVIVVKKKVRQKKQSFLIPRNAAHNYNTTNYCFLMECRKDSSGWKLIHFFSSFTKFISEVWKKTKVPSRNQNKLGHV